MAVYAALEAYFIINFTSSSGGWRRCSGAWLGWLAFASVITRALIIGLIRLAFCLAFEFVFFFTLFGELFLTFFVGIIGSCHSVLSLKFNPYCTASPPAPGPGRPAGLVRPPARLTNAPVHPCKATAWCAKRVCRRAHTDSWGQPSCNQF